MDNKITGEEIIAELRYAWKEFGKYAYEDKGADEVIDVDKIAQKLKADYDGAGIIVVLKEVIKIKDSRLLVSSLLQSFDDDDELMMQLEAADSEFVGEHY